MGRLFGDALQEERTKRNMTQEAIAALLETDQSEYSKYETGKRLPHPNTVADMEKRLGIEDGRLMTARNDDRDNTTLSRVYYSHVAREEVRKVIAKHVIAAVERALTELEEVFANSDNGGGTVTPSDDD